MSGAVRSGCVVVEAMQTADKYLRVLIFALLMKQLDFKLYTKHQSRPRRRGGGSPHCAATWPHTLDPHQPEF